MSTWFEEISHRQAMRHYRDRRGGIGKPGCFYLEWLSKWERAERHCIALENRMLGKKERAHLRRRWRRWARISARAARRVGIGYGTQLKNLDPVTLRERAPRMSYPSGLFCQSTQTKNT